MADQWEIPAKRLLGKIFDVAGEGPGVTYNSEDIADITIELRAAYLKGLEDAANLALNHLDTDHPHGRTCSNLIFMRIHSRIDELKAGK